MVMTNMQMTAEEAKEYSDGCCVPDAGDAPKYPYGLCIRLNDGTLEKLGLAGPLAVGTEVLVVAKAKVTGTSAREDQKGESESDMELQITDLELQQAPAVSDPKKMYPNSNMA